MTFPTFEQQETIAGIEARLDRIEKAIGITVDPAPAEPVEPAPEPVPVEPAPAEPVPVEPAPAEAVTPDPPATA